MLVAKLFTINKEFINAIPVSSLRWTRQKNKEYSIDIDFATTPPENMYYVKIIDSDQSLKFIPSGYVSKSSSGTEFTLSSWENSLEAEGWIPDNWQWWDGKLLSTVIADHCYGFRKIGIATTSQLSSFMDYEHVQVSALDSGNGSVYLDTHGYFIEESEVEVAYYENGFAIYRVELPDEARRQGLVLRWSDSVGKTTDISVQFRWSDSPYDYEGAFSNELSPARCDNIKPNESKGVDIPEGSETYLFIKFNLKYDSGIGGVNFENEITTVNEVVYYGKTPILSAFEVIYRVATSVSPGTISVPVQALTANVHEKSTLLESLKAISEAYGISFYCDIESSGIVTLNSYSAIGDDIRSTAGVLTDTKNINVSDKSDALEIIEGVHCFGAGDGIDRIYSFVKIGGIDNPKKVSTLEDGDITSIAALELAGAQFLEDENEISSKITFEYYGSPRIALHDHISLLVDGEVRENDITEESIDCGANGVDSRKYTIGFKAYPFRSLYGYTFSGSYLRTPQPPTGVSAIDIDGTWYISWLGSADEFLIEYKISSAIIWSRTTVPSNQCIVNNIQPGYEYMFRVYAIVDGVMSEASTTIATSLNSEDLLTSNEKTQYRIEWEDFINKKVNADTYADNYGLASLKSDLDTATQNLADYMNDGDTWASGIPLWISDSQIGIDTDIDFVTFVALWSEAWASYEDIINAVRLLTSVSIQLTSSSVSRNRAEDMTPESVAAFSKTNDGSLYSGRFIISVSYDGTSFIDLYTSPSDESSTSFEVPAKIEIEAVEYYITSIRFRLYTAGGTSIQLDQSICSVITSAETSPIYLGSIASADPEVPYVINDYYFDSRAVGIGGLLKIFNGTAWVEYTDLIAGYQGAVMDALADMSEWSEDQGSVVDAASGVFDKLFADVGYLRSIFSHNIEVTGSIKTYDGQGVNRRANEISNSNLDWLDTPDGGPEQLRARIGRLGVGGSVLLDGDFQVKTNDSSWGSESVIKAAQSSNPSYIQTSDGQLRIAYTRGSDYYIVERIWSGSAWGAESVINAAQSDYPSYIQTSSGQLRISYTRITDLYLVERIWSGSAWGAESVINAAKSDRASYIQTSDGQLRIAYTISAGSNYLVERIWSGSAWGAESVINAAVTSSPSYIQTSDGQLRIAYISNPMSYLRERIWSGSAWGAESVINAAAAFRPSYVQTVDGQLRIAYKRASDNYLVERIWSGSAWGAESVINAANSNNPAYFQSKDGLLRIAYVQPDPYHLVERTLTRYQSLSYPQSGYVAGSGWWQKDADGTLTQWGRKTFPTAGIGSQTFPINFVGDLPEFASSVIPYGGYETPSSYCLNLVAWAKYTIINGNGISWIAKGRWK